jgi:hypothetical protein
MKPAMAAAFSGRVMKCRPVKGYSGMYNYFSIIKIKNLVFFTINPQPAVLT